jgi:ribose transport system permease protein
MNTTATAPVAVQRTTWKQLAGNFLIRHIMVVVMLLIVAFFAYRSARFATPDNLTNILIAAAPFALIALGQTLVILTGGIDLSVGSVMAASAMAAAWTAKNAGGDLMLPLLAALVTGLIAGSINGLIVSRFEVPPFITTLGMLTLASGIAYVIGNGAPINGLPANFGTFANTQILGLTLPVILMILAILALAFVMKRTNYGLRVYAIGGNRLAAEIAGVRSRGILFSVYAISGVLAGISGLMLASRVITGAPNLGQGYELDAIAAVVIGGASLMGGRGTIWGTAIGLLLIQTINNGLDLLLVPAYWQNVIKGIIIVAAVGVDVWASRSGRR